MARPMMVIVTQLAQSPEQGCVEVEVATFFSVVTWQRPFAAAASLKLCCAFVAHLFSAARFCCPEEATATDRPAAVATPCETDRGPRPMDVLKRVRALVVFIPVLTAPKELCTMLFVVHCVVLQSMLVLDCWQEG